MGNLVNAYSLQVRVKTGCVLHGTGSTENQFIIALGYYVPWFNRRHEPVMSMLVH